METKEKNNPTEVPNIPTADNQKGIENHKKAASHFEAAAKSHLAAAKHHEDENNDKAAKSTIEAHGHSSIANEAQKEDVKHHTSKI